MERLPSLRSLQPQPRRRNSYSGVTVHLTCHLLETLLSKVSEFCPTGDDLVYCHHLQNQLRQGNVHLNNLDLEELSCFLEDLLSSTRGRRDIPSAIVIDIHSCIGLVQERQGMIERAIRSLLRALWIEKKALPNPLTNAITKHRLGLLYAKKGDYGKAVFLLEKALEGYHEARMKPGHICIRDAEESLQDFRVKKLEQELDFEASCSSSTSDHLSRILEEAPSPSAAIPSVGGGYQRRYSR